MQTKIRKSRFLILAIAIMLISSVALYVTINDFSVIQSNVAAAASFDEEMSPSKSKPANKIYSNATINDDFCPDSIIVVLDESISSVDGLTKGKKDDLFKGIQYKNINDLTGLNASTKNNAKLKKHFNKTALKQILQIELKQSSKQGVLNVISELEKVDGILYAGPDYITEIESDVDDYALDTMALNFSAMPNDPHLSDQWGLIGTYGINAEGAWEITTGSSTVRVGVIDTGIANHEDLNANLVEGRDFFNNNNITNDDTRGHGTHVAGTIGAVGNNGIGVSGVAQNIGLVPLQASNANNMFDESTRIKAIQYATSLWGTDQQITVINHSISGFGESVGLLSAIEQFPGLFVWSAGNDTADVDQMSKVSQFNLENLISVGAITNSGMRAGYSNYGSRVDIYAPGSGIFNTIPNGYISMNGTSMAAPHVAGVAALIASKYPNLDAAGIKYAILGGSVQRTISTPDGNQIVKLLRADKALIQAGKIPTFPQLAVESTGWNINISNNNPQTNTITYNERMCFEGDAKEFHHLTNLRSFKLSSNGNRTIRITPFNTAGYIAVAIAFQLDNGDTIYRVSYANGLSSSGMNAPKHYTVSGGAVGNADLVPNYLEFELTERYGIAPYEWDVKLINNNSVAVSVTYNSRMCFDDAARNFYGLRDLADVTVPANSSSTVRIKGNGSAQYITAAINYTVDGTRYRRISSANGLAIDPFRTNPVRHHEVLISSIFPTLPVHPANLSMIPYSRSGFIWYTWGVTISNNSNYTVEVSYNAKLCFENDARDFENLADIVTISIPAKSSKNVTINHNGTAGWIAACINYSYNGDEYRRITYANGLATNPYRTNRPEYNLIRFT